MSAEPFVKVSASFYLKNPPKGHLGLRHENWTFGNKPVPFSILAGHLLRSLLQFYIVVMPTPIRELNIEIKRLGDFVAKLEVVDDDVER